MWLGFWIGNLLILICNSLQQNLMENYFHFQDEDWIFATIKTTLNYSQLQNQIENYKKENEDCYNVDWFIEYLNETWINKTELIIVENIYF